MYVKTLYVHTFNTMVYNAFVLKSNEAYKNELSNKSWLSFAKSFDYNDIG